MEVRTAVGWRVILDAGTGIRALGRTMMAAANGAPLEGDIFLTHAHWDHIQGLPFFAPIFQRGNHFTIWGFRSLQTSIDRVVRDQMSPVVFPVTFEQLDAAIDFRELSEGDECEGTGYRVQAIRVRHPGGALGYRFTDPADGGSLVYISDNELDPSARYDDVDDAWRDRLVAFTRGASVLVHDATYTRDEYDRHRGWGHSTVDDALALALDGEVGTLVLFHHEPERKDEDVDRCVDEARALVRRRGGSVEVIAAAEGLTLTIQGPRRDA